jgi:putative heme degradation protein
VSNENGARLIEYAQVEAKALRFLARQLEALEAELAKAKCKHEPWRLQVEHASQLTAIILAAADARVEVLTSPKP